MEQFTIYSLQYYINLIHFQNNLYTHIHTHAQTHTHTYKIMFRWLEKNKNNQATVDKIILKKAVRARVHIAQKLLDTERNQLWKSFCVETAPLIERRESTQLCQAIVGGIVDGVCSVINLRNAATEVTSVSDHSSAAAVRVVLQLVNKNVKNHMQQASLKSRQIMTLTWLERSALIWLFLCPQIYPGYKGSKRLQRVATAGGIHFAALKKWVAKKGKYSKKFVHKWFHIVANMTWKDVKIFFPTQFTATFGAINEELGVQEQLLPWKHVVATAATVSLNKFMIDLRSGAKRAALAKKRPNSFQNMTTKTKRARRSDSGRARKHPDVADKIQNFVQERWNTGDPCTRRLCMLPN